MIFYISLRFRYDICPKSQVFTTMTTVGYGSDARGGFVRCQWLCAYRYTDTVMYNHAFNYVDICMCLTV